MEKESVITKEIIPEVTWFQTKEKVVFDVCNVNFDKYDLNINDKFFEFSSHLNDIIYKIKFELFDNFTSYNSEKYNNKIRVFLTKKEESPFWTRLTEVKNLYKNNIKINWNNWVDEDGDEEEDDNKNFDMEAMMRAMGGGGMPGMGMPGMDMPDMSSMVDEMPDLEGDEEGNCCDEEECSNTQDEDCCGTKDCCDIKEESKCYN